eukprot:TRINITY_DN3128_c0_g1_i6.p1 TRINITY_DN3128_c0_g1~~TRINITY_DN3128_c0_g1_i6.p1  ORF type:complete len:489 (-),score=112.82 TRINITY_DN3128_c0_g1_i6:47-1513(-)
MTNTMWVGSVFGAMQFAYTPTGTRPVKGDDSALPADVYDRGTWRVFSGARFLPCTSASVLHSCNVVRSISVSTVHTGTAAAPAAAFVATPTGLAVIRHEMIRLSDKAQYFQDVVAPRHNRYGLVSMIQLPQYGVLSGAHQSADESDGLWTSVYGIAQALRYAAERQPAALQEAHRIYDALHFLATVSGVRGYISRSFARATDFNITGWWHVSPVDPGWIFQADQSSDSLTANLCFYTVYYHLVASTPTEKQQCASVIADVVDSILKNNYYYIDVTGQPTRWGMWNPDVLNNDPDWQEERGLNSIQILAYLSSAYAVTGNVTYLHALNDLVTVHELHLNLLNQHVEATGDNNFSDDELGYLAYYMYYMATQIAMQNAVHIVDDDERQLLKDTLTTIRQAMVMSMERSGAIVSNEGSPFYAAVYRSIVGSIPEQWVASVMMVLETWPTELITWPVDNSARLDVDWWTEDRDGLIVRQLLPMQERLVMRVC